MRLHGTYIGLMAILPALVQSTFAPYQPLTASFGLGSKVVAVNENTVFKLCSDGIAPDTVILDYGRDIEGYATFNVTHMSGNTSVFEMSYAESRALLDNYMVSISPHDEKEKKKN
jgi:hypothetical protein